MSLNLLVVDDHAIFREGLKSLIVKEPDMVVVGEVGNGTDAVRLASELRPDVVIMDISMPDMNGIEATRRIIAELPDTGVLVLSMESDRRFIVEVLEAKALGYIMKEAVFLELANAIRMVANHETYLGPRITELILNGLS